MQEPTFSLGSQPHERLTVRVIRRNHPESLEYWDGNWLTAEISISSGTFKGHFEAFLRTNEFASFRRELQALYESLNGSASFEPMEPWLEINVTGDGKGHFVARCVARDDLADDRRFHFSTMVDQTELAIVLDGLNEIMSAFPVFAGTS